MNSNLFMPSLRAPASLIFHFFAVLTMALLALAILTGCERISTPKQAPPEVAPDSAEPAQAAPGAGLRVVASAELPAAPKRIVTLAPNVTEILFALGAGERVVAVTRYDDYPADVKSLPKIGGIIDVDLEAILTQKPDLVMGTSAGSDGALIAKLDKSKIPYLFVQMNTLAETYGGIQAFGDALGLGDAATDLRAEMKSEIDAIAQSANRDAAPHARPRVLFVFGHDPLVAAGPGSYGDEMLTLVGAQNAVGDANNPYPVLDIEKILSLNPDRIIDATITPDADPAPGGEGFWSTYASLNAVKNGHVYYFQDPVLLRPAPRLVEGLKIMHKAINGTASEDK